MMYKLADVLSNDLFSSKVAQSFIPHSRSLTKAWTQRPADQIIWGKQNVNALLSLDKWLSEKTTPPSAKKFYLAAAGLRKQIAKKMKGEDNYANHRFNDNQASLHTTIIGDGRWGDQFQEGINLLVEHPATGDSFEKSVHVFHVDGYPSDHSKQLLMVNACQNYLKFQDKKIRLAGFKHYSWHHKNTHGYMEYFDFSNCFNQDLDLVFQFLDNNKLNLWIDHGFTDEQFYEKLAELAWYLAQASPLENGSASTSEIVLRFCLIKRFGTQASLFYKPGISWDIAAMVTTLDDYKKIFKASWLPDAPTDQKKINKAYNAQPSKKSDLYARYAVHGLMTHYTQNTILEDHLKPLFWTNEDLLLFAHVRDHSTAELVKLAMSGQLQCPVRDVGARLVSPS